MEIYRSKVIVAPLNWGLGHATRCIPIIDKLISQENEVFLASDGVALALLKLHYPSLPAFTLPGYDIKYNFNSIHWDLISQSPRLLAAYVQEQRCAKKLQHSTGAAFIISDNRFGFRTRKAHNIYITHQLDIPPHGTIFSRMANFAHHRLINAFQECWVPDYADHRSLGGKLSKGILTVPITYLGPVSRFTEKDTTQDIDILVILSGPEPKRTHLENALSKKLINVKDSYRVHFIRGTQRPALPEIPFSFDNLITGKKLNNLMNRSRLVISRSGYTTIMDLDKLNKKAILIPTPGQYEQEYLALYLEKNENFTPLKEIEIEKSLLSTLITILNEN